ncbi:uncharacterized protein LOC116202917 [Punica granatum]|uniref:Uncharacterized protein n=2 Tax=Punica granatum TaxID=22663 RepID=A0A218XIY5_PUNGR|nr:uncharacterized protein LOC116202917 [Punica granatum]XP_031390412.1 uncharacterized protein LOC116202917 [Punica granatum]XP_031390413.1 uncharacterized protein LOC116202917 [Punica granatum]OWM84874.1 hypothetical protein CDL15_Pgr027661 [Punica granatum]PKI74881.1 hypothetical protein CRG98_004653 [Punica granatum]
MNEFVPERSRSWSVYAAANSNPSQTGFETEEPWKSFGASINAISFGFVATAILISMFLIMAIFEHLFRPVPSIPSQEGVTTEISLEAGLSHKAVDQDPVPMSYASDFSVVMPGQNYPTYIAQPAPLPCQREGIRWPSHEHSTLAFS